MPDPEKATFHSHPRFLAPNDVYSRHTLISPEEIRKMPDEEWINTLEDGRKVKFIYQELPEDGAFITAQLAGNEVVYSVISADLFVFPSETDTFGLAVLEALSSGVPAVVTAVGGPKYTVQHGKTGYVVYIHRASADPTGIALADGFCGARTCSFDLVGTDFRGMYKTYERCFYAADSVRHEILDVASV